MKARTLLSLPSVLGEPVTTPQEILVNVGENVVSEFDPPCVDVVELVGMAFPFPSLHNYMELFMLN